jgi:hypothetical protein
LLVSGMIHPRIKKPQPLEQEAEVVAGAGEDGVDTVSVLALEVIAVEQAVILHVADNGFDSGSPSQVAADGFGAGFVAGLPDLEAVESVALVALIDVNAFGGDAGPGFGALDGGLQGVTVIGIAVQGVDVDDELAARWWPP